MNDGIVTKLADKLAKFKSVERQSIIHRTAKVTLGASVVRPFLPKTKKDLTKALRKISIDQLKACRNQEEFDQFFVDNLAIVDRALKKRNSKNGRMGRGRKWGHGTKVLCLYLRGIVMHTRYFNDRTAKRLSHFLYVPIDRIVLKQLKKWGVPLQQTGIRDIETEEQFREIQAWLTTAAKMARAPRILFDDIWSRYRPGTK